MKNTTQHIAILYALTDDEEEKNGKGWVSQFKRFLEMILQQMGGSQDVAIHMVPDDMVLDPKQADILIPVLSPDFILSGPCMDGVEGYMQRLSDEEIIERVFKVFKYPLEWVDQPKKILHNTAYNLFHTNTETGKAETYEDFFSPDAEKQYWMKMIDLCYDIHETMVQQGDKPGTSTRKRKVIYLAEVGPDLSSQRNIIKRELQRHGYLVLPHRTLPENFQDMEKMVKENLAQSDLSIHMVGSAYGVIPHGADRSIVDIQNMLATEKCMEDKGFHRLIWIDPSLNNVSDKQKAFIHRLKRDDEASYGAEILQTSLEDFKNTIWEELIQFNLNNRFRVSSENTLGKDPEVYLIYDKCDQDFVQSLKESLASEKVSVLEPAFEGDLMELRNVHIDHLKQMDAAIVYQNQVNEQWVHMKLLDLLKAPGLGRNKPLISKTLVIAEQVTWDTEQLKRYGIEVIEEKNQKAIATFIADVKQKFKTQKSVAAS